LNRVHHAADLDDPAVAGALDDAAASHRKGRVDHVRAVIEIAKL
jgi:hypothetical protein